MTRESASRPIVTRRRCRCCTAKFVALDGVDIGMVRKAADGRGWEAGVFIDDEQGTQFDWYYGAWATLTAAVDAIMSADAAAPAGVQP